MLGDVCEQCNNLTPCGCGCHEEEEPQPCLPGPNNAECPEPIDFKCVFWMGDPIPGTPIKKGWRGTEVVFYLMNRIKELEARVTILETP